jgi:hypothetical protein
MYDNTLLSSENFKEKKCRGIKITLFVSNNFLPKIVPLVRKCVKRMVKPDRPQIKV